MFKKPYYASLLTMLGAPLIVVLIDVSVVILMGMESYEANHIDNLMHYIGGIAATIFSAGMLYRLVPSNDYASISKNIFRLLVAGMLCAIIILWEVSEYVLLILGFPTYWLGQNTYVDTVADMVFGIMGCVTIIMTISKTASPVHKI